MLSWGWFVVECARTTYLPNDKVQVSMEKAGDRKGEIIYRLSRASAISETKHSDMEYEDVVIQAKSSYYLKNNGGYKVLLDRPRFIISCSVSSNMKRNRISIRVGNRVKVLIDSPDFDFFKKGTIFYRFR